MRAVPFSVLFALLSICLPASSVRAVTITTDFEGYVVTPDSFVNNLGQASGSTSFHALDGTSYNNFWDTTFGDFWEGWTISNVSTLLFDSGQLQGFPNQYAAVTGVGAGGSATYAVAFTNGFSSGDAYINLAAGTTPISADFNNSAYAYSSMVFGDGFAKQFSADDNDFLRLEITGHSEQDKTGTVVGSVEFFLSQTQLDQLLILSDWETVDLTSLAGSQSLSFHLTSSDNGLFGMNTPAYFALDNFVFAEINQAGGAPEPGTGLMLLAGSLLLSNWRKKRPGI